MRACPHHNFAVIALMIMKFGTGIKLDVFYTMVTKIVTSLLLRNYDVITCILANISNFYPIFGLRNNCDVINAKYVIFLETNYIHQFMQFSIDITQPKCFSGSTQRGTFRNILQ